MRFATCIQTSHTEHCASAAFFHSFFESASRKSCRRQRISVFISHSPSSEERSSEEFAFSISLCVTVLQQYDSFDECYISIYLFYFSLIFLPLHFPSFANKNLTTSDGCFTTPLHRRDEGEETALEILKVVPAIRTPKLALARVANFVPAYETLAP